MIESSDGETFQQLKTTCLAEVLTDSELSEIAGLCKQESYPMGHLLVRRGELLDKLFIVVKGCVRGVIHQGAQTRIWGYVNSGEVFGQFGLLSNEPSVADLYCEFETQMLTIDRIDVAGICERFPALHEWLKQGFYRRFKTSLTDEKLRRFARQVVFACPPGVPAVCGITTRIVSSLARRGERVAMVTNRNTGECPEKVERFLVEDEVEVNELVSRLKLQRFDRIFCAWTIDHSDSFFQLLHEADELLWCFQAESPGLSQEILTRYLNESESASQKIKRICLLSEGQMQAPEGLTDPRLQKRDIIMPSKPSGGDHRLFEQGVSRIYHHLCDVRTGIALAGGGARGLVHFGVLRSLDRAGIYFDMMSGTSAGAMFGLSYATGLDIDYMLREYRQKLTPGFPFNVLPGGQRWFLVWKYRSRSWESMLRQYFDCDFEQLQIPCAAITVDLVSGREIVRESGDIVEAMLESLNLPLIANPIFKDGMALVDGGVLNNLPADVLVDRGADFVLGIDVSTGMTKQYGRNVPGMSSQEMRPAGSLETLFRVFEVMGTGTAELRSPAIDMLIQPRTAEYAFTDFTRGFELAEIGEQSMDARVSELQQQIDDLLQFRRPD